MRITRDVIYDLLPGYFAGDVSADTRALIDEFLQTDQEFARMTARFRRLYDERGSLPAEVTAERDQFERARRRAEALQICAAFAVAFGLAAVFPFVMDYLRGQSFPGTPFLSLVFGVVACSSAVWWIVIRMRPV